MSNKGRGFFEGTPIGGLIAYADLSSYQYHAVKLAGTTSTYDFTVDVVSGSTDVPIGLLANIPDVAGKECLVYGVGSKVVGKAGGTINAGARLAPDASGHIVAISGTGQICIGQALHYAVSGDLVEFIFGGGLSYGTS